MCCSLTNLLPYLVNSLSLVPTSPTTPQATTAVQCMIRLHNFLLIILSFLITMLVLWHLCSFATLSQIHTHKYIRTHTNKTFTHITFYAWCCCSCFPDLHFYLGLGSYGGGLMLTGSQYTPPPITDNIGNNATNNSSNNNNIAVGCSNKVMKNVIVNSNTAEIAGMFEYPCLTEIYVYISLYIYICIYSVC